MPKVERVDIFDDLEYKNGDGEAVEATQTRVFSVGGKTYETFLCEDNAKAFDEDMAVWTEWANPIQSVHSGGRSPSRRPTGGGAENSGSRKPRNETHKIREWAKHQQFNPPVSDRGRIPSHVNEAYYAAHPDETPES